MDRQIITGFSKLTKKEKIDKLAHQLGDNELLSTLENFWHSRLQEKFDHFSENTLSNFYLPYGIAPNFLIDGEIFHVPMVIEESSVVAAASSAARFWSEHGGFHTQVIATQKTGQVHFIFSGDKAILIKHWDDIKKNLKEDARPFTQNMENRGGGIKEIKLENGNADIEGYYKLDVLFETANSMGANFINTVLESMASSMINYCNLNAELSGRCEIIMSILSNYTPDCLVKCWVEAPCDVLNKLLDTSSETSFVSKFEYAVKIARTDVYRAVTHNKGIMNGVDGVVIATGNDFRAIEAGVHAFASKSGRYSSLSDVNIKNGIFNFSLELPLNLGVVGGLTSAHPLAQKAIQLLGEPDASGLMRIAAAAGLANHFSAIKALVTSGIQKGHMKMHLYNILNQLQASGTEIEHATQYFSNQPVTFNHVRQYLEDVRKGIQMS